MNISIVDSSASVVSLLDVLENQPTHPPSLYLDIEGIALSRYGSISIIQLFHLPLNHVFLIDIFVLQKAAFNIANRSGTTLRSILESALIPKVFFDVRNDADALYAHFNISLQGVHDIQLLEVATRSWSKDRVVGLGYCIKHDARLSAEARRRWKATKERGLSLFAAEHGGSYEIFNVRPMLQDIVSYCAQDVELLPALWEVYSQKIGKKWLGRVREETEKRVLMSQNELYDPHGEEKVLSPWANAVTSGKKDRSGKGRVSEIERKETVSVRDTENRDKSNAAQISAAKAAHREAQKKLSGVLIGRSPAAHIEPQPSRQTADPRAAQMTPTAARNMPEYPTPYINIPSRTKAAAHGKAIAKPDIQPPPIAFKPMWTCTTCNRKMLQTQRHDHSAGKAHLARLKQVSSPALDTPPQPTTTNGKSLKAATTTTAQSRQPNARPTTKPHGENPREVGPKSTKRKNGAATRSTYPHPEAHTYSDWGFVGFEGNRSVASFAYDGYHFGGGEDYGLCDKDCGWCGHCMDSADF